MAKPPNQLAQDKWLKEWHQRQKQQNPNTYNASWEPEAGWRGRFNQSQQQPPVHSQAHNPGQPMIPGTRDPVPPPPPPPPVYSPPGFRTLAPVGVPEGGWGGGAIEHTQGQLISGTPPPQVTGLATATMAKPSFGAIPPTASAILPWWHQGGSGVRPTDNSQWLKGGRPPTSPAATSPAASAMRPPVGTPVTSRPAPAWGQASGSPSRPPPSWGQASGSYAPFDPATWRPPQRDITMRPGYTAPRTNAMMEY